MALSLNIEKVSLLPYHEGGSAKRLQIGHDKWNFLASAPSYDHLNQLVDIFGQHGVDAAVRS